MPAVSLQFGGNKCHVARGGTSVPAGKTNDPDGSPLEGWYLPCGLFLPSRTFPSGPLQRLGVAEPECKPESQFAAKPPKVAVS
jgi:hypothetical protein